MLKFPQRIKRIVVATTVTLGLVAGSVVAAPPASAYVPTQTHANILAGYVFNLLNSERALHGLPALHSNTYLKRSARKHNMRMAKYNTMSHQLPGEMGLGSRITYEGYHWRACGENIAWNTDWTLGGALYLQKLMYNEKYPDDGHRRNILSSTYRDVGVDIYVDTTHHKIWLTEDFGRWYGT